jgi:hypothetical protein
MMPSTIGRAQGRPGARRPHGPRAKKNARGGHHRFGRDIPAFPARWAYGCSALSPGTGCLAPVARLLVKACELGISTGMPGPHGLAVREGTSHEAQLDRLDLRPPKPRRTCRPMSLVWQHRRGHRCPPHVRDDRDTPLRSRRDGRIKPRFLEKRKRNFAAGRSGTGDVLDRAHENSFCAPKIAPVVHRQTNRPMRRPDASAWIRLSSRSFISVSVSIDNCSREPPSNLFSVASGAAGQPCLSMRRRTRWHGIVHLKRQPR